MKYAFKNTSVLIEIWFRRLVKLDFLLFPKKLATEWFPNRNSIQTDMKWFQNNRGRLWKEHYPMPNVGFKYSRYSELHAYLITAFHAPWMSIESWNLFMCCYQQTFSTAVKSILVPVTSEMKGVQCYLIQLLAN